MVFTAIGSRISKLFSTTRKTADALINDPVYRARNFGSNSFLKRAGVASVYLTAGAGLAIGSGQTEDRLRNYYGEERFTSYFGGGFDTLKTLGIVGGAAGAGFAFMGTDPLSRIGRSIYKETARIPLMGARSAFFSAAGRTPGATFRGGNFSVGIENKIRSLRGSDLNNAVRNLYNRVVGSIRPLYNMEALGKASRGPMPAARATQSSFIAPANIRMPFRQPLTGNITTDVRMPFPTNTTGARQAPFVRPENVKPNPLVQEPMFRPVNAVRPPFSTGIRDPLSAAVRPTTIDQVVQSTVQNAGTRQFSTFIGRQERAALKRRLGEIRGAVQSSKDEIASLASQPGLSFRFSASMGLIAMGQPVTEILGKENTTNAVLLGAGLATAKIGTKIAKAGGLPVTAVSAGLASVVGMSASRVSENMPEEGNITDISVYNRGRDGVSKMNFSTAGLVFALHNANRRYQ